MVDGYRLSDGLVFFPPTLPFLLHAVLVLQRRVVGLSPHDALLNIAEQSP